MLGAPPYWLFAVYREGKCRGVKELGDTRRLYEAHPQAVQRWVADYDFVSRADIVTLRRQCEPPVPDHAVEKETVATGSIDGDTAIVVNVFRDRHHYNREDLAATSMNPRIYEALACGALVLSEPREEIARVLPELPTFRRRNEKAPQGAFFVGHRKRFTPPSCVLCLCRVTFAVIHRHDAPLQSYLAVTFLFSSEICLIRRSHMANRCCQREKRRSPASARLL